jgi:hypothetical protein
LERGGGSDWIAAAGDFHKRAGIARVASEEQNRSGEILWKEENF